MAGIAEFEESGHDLEYRGKPIDIEKEGLIGGLIDLLLHSDQADSTENDVQAIASHCATMDILSAYNQRLVAKAMG